LALIGLVLVAGVVCFQLWRTFGQQQPVHVDPVLSYVAGNAEKLRAQVKESKGYEQRLADEQKQEMQALDDGIAREPDNADLRVKRALKFDLQGDHEAALRDIEAAMSRDNSRRYYLLFLRHRQLDKLGRTDEALADVLEAIRLAPPGTGYQRFAAEIQRRLGNPAAGVLVFDEALHREPANLFLRAERAEYLAKIGRFDEAVSDITAAVEQEPNSDQRQMRSYERMKILIAARRFDEALAVADRYVSQHPDDSIGFGVRSEIHEAMGEHGAARRDYEKKMDIINSIR
jgi:tetratricopeptide (TPR) repeat protein